MPDVTSRSAEISSAGPPAIEPDERRPHEVPFLFEQRKRLPGAFGVSMVAHAVAIAALLLVIRYAPTTVASVSIMMAHRFDPNIIWLNEPGPGGGGGGGGNRMKDPPRKAELPGKDKITVPVQKPTNLDKPVTKDEPQPEQQLTIPAKMLTSGEQTLPGALEGTSASNTLSQGPGSGGGAGTGTGTGIGPGQGSGLGPGSGGGFGGGAYRPGSGIDNPVLIREVKPLYTPDALRAKIQGVVLLEAVVQPDGTVSDVQVVRSLDPVFGLDQEAVKAAKQWRFIPGKRQGLPVPVLVTIELTFTLR
jgi:periplasmic protein TonB